MNHSLKIENWKLKIALAIVFLVLPFFASAAVRLQMPPNYLVTASGLVGYWTFDGKDTNWGTNKTNDLSGQGNTGTMTSMSTTTSPVAGKIGQGLKFDGVDDRVEIPSFTLTGEASCSAWIYPTSFSGFQKHIFDDIDGSGNGQFGCEYDRTTAKVSVTWNTSVVLTGNALLEANKWSHIVITRAGSAGSWVARIYINGVLDATSAPTATDPDTSVGNFGIGTSPNYTSGLVSGNIDDVRIYNRALSAAEVRNLYTSGAGKVNVTSSANTALTSGLVGHWTFDGKDTNWGTNKTNDLSGQGNTGTMTSMSTTTSPVAGKIGQGLKFDAALSQYVNNSSFSWPAASPITVSFWNFVPSTPSIVSSAFNIGSFSGSNRLQCHCPYTDNILYWDYGDANGNGRISTSYAGYIGKWTYVTLVSNASNFKAIYLDGSLITSSSASITAIGDSTGINIGAWSATSNYHSGNIDDFRIYDRALSAAEIRNLYTSGAGKVNVTSSANTALTSGLVGHWTFDGKDMIPNVRDVSGQGNHGGLQNQNPTTTAIGKLGQALNFDGVDDYVNSTVTVVDAQQNITLSAWVYLTASGSYPGIAVKTSAFDEGTAKYSFYLYLSSRIPKMAIGGSLTSQTGAAIPLNTWTHLVYVNSSSGYVIYENGVSVENGAALPAPTTSSDTWKIGKWIGGSGYFPGSLDDVRIYNRALSADEVRQLYLMGK